MRRPALLGLAGLVLLAVCLIAGGWRGAAASYLAAWLVLLALPVGALPVVIVAERFGKRVRERGGIEMLAGLRRLTALMPVAAVLALPLLAAAPLLYPWVSAPARTPLAGLWFTVPFFVVRVIVYLAAWTGCRCASPNRSTRPAKGGPCPRWGCTR
ncbi:hypothetical protein [Methylobacterium tardum]|uniref:hypothetical protein n=1 Tax=Methylobacterium tardum TaxID=374432 RepID=UPI00360D53F0